VIGDTGVMLDLTEAEIRDVLVDMLEHVRYDDAWEMGDWYPGYVRAVYEVASKLGVNIDPD
jgi:hypothetical protein